MVDLEKMFQSLVDEMYRDLDSRVSRKEFSKEEGQELERMIEAKFGWMSSSSECARFMRINEDTAEMSEIIAEEAWSSSSEECAVIADLLDKMCEEKNE